jgi:hypothetical protein
MAARGCRGGIVGTCASAPGKRGSIPNGRSRMPSFNGWTTPGRLPDSSGRAGNYVHSLVQKTRIYASSTISSGCDMLPENISLPSNQRSTLIYLEIVSCLDNSEQITLQDHF